MGNRSWRSPPHPPAPAAETMHAVRGYEVCCRHIPGARLGRPPGCFSCCPSILSVAEMGFSLLVLPTRVHLGRLRGGCSLQVSDSARTLLHTRCDRRHRAQSMRHRIVRMHASAKGPIPGLAERNLSIERAFGLSYQPRAKISLIS